MGINRRRNPRVGITAFLLFFLIAGVPLAVGDAAGSDESQRALVVDAREGADSQQQAEKSVKQFGEGVKRALILVPGDSWSGCGAADPYCALFEKDVSVTVLRVGDEETKDVVDDVFGSGATTEATPEKQERLFLATSERSDGFSLGMGVFIAVLLAAACAAVTDRMLPWRSGTGGGPKHGTRVPAGNSEQPPVTERPDQPERPPVTNRTNHAPPAVAPSSATPAGALGDLTAVYARHRNVGRARTHIDATGGYAEFGDLVVWVALSSRQPGCLAPGSAVQVIADGGLETGLTVGALPGHDGAGSPYADGAPHRTATSEGETSA